MGMHDSLALDYRSKAGTQECDQRAGDLGFWLAWAFFCALCVVIVAKYQFVGGAPYGSGGDGASGAWDKTVTIVLHQGVSCSGVATLC